MKDAPSSKWWGWGDPDKRFDLSLRPYFFSNLKSILKIENAPHLFPPPLEKISVPETKLDHEEILALEKILSPEGIWLSSKERITHAYGKSFRDLMRIRYGIFENIPDAILIPRSEADILRILEWAQQNKIAVIPRGGGTSVVGGVEAVSDPTQRKRVVLDMRALNRVLSISETDMIAEVETGIFGGDLETQLNQKGFSLCHFPESFQYSTLGGWIAARSAGQQSTLYGKIEDMVESLRLITPAGVVDSLPVPAAANGPDWDQLIIGSEGIFGIISRARMKLKILPQEKYYTAYLFNSFEAGMAAVQEIIRQGILPSTVRLSDSTETDFIFSLREISSAFSALLDRNMQKWFAWKGFVPHKRSLLILGLEGTLPKVKYEKAAIKKIFKHYTVFHLGSKVGNGWYRHRFENPYLRDELLGYELIVDTLETATEWGNVEHLHAAVKSAIEAAFRELEIKGVVMAHLSHLYTTGSSLYFIFLAKPHRGRALEEWTVIKRAASDTIVENGGTISHHHGVGIDHRPWIRKELGTLQLQLLRQMKKQFDPAGILNPGKLLPTENET